MTSKPCQALILVLLSSLTRATVITSEFNAIPSAEGWDIAQQWCEPIVWTIDGLHSQQLSGDACPGEEAGARDAYTRSIAEFNGHPRWFFEYRLSASADSSEIPGGAPTVLATGNAAGNLYHSTVAANQVKLSGDGDIPAIFYDLEPGVPHCIRLELINDPPPAIHRWFVDSILVYEGPADSPFPDYDARVTWQGRSWHQPTFNQWDYIRFGDIPVSASGDFDSNGVIDTFDHYYFSECMDRGSIGEPASPSCAWADFDSDNTVNCADLDSFRAAWTGPSDPPAACIATSVPAVSEWGCMVMVLLVLTAGSVIFRHTVAT